MAKIELSDEDWLKQKPDHTLFLRDGARDDLNRINAEIRMSHYRTKLNKLRGAISLDGTVFLEDALRDTAKVQCDSQVESMDATVDRRHAGHEDSESSEVVVHEETI